MSYVVVAPELMAAASFPFSAMARSDENLPLRAIFRIDIFAQDSRSCHAALTHSWASTALECRSEAGLPGTWGTDGQMGGSQPF